MPVEAFAQAVAKGMTATDAYSEAGYKGDRTAASRLSTNVNIASRVDQIKNRVESYSTDPGGAAVARSWALSIGRLLERLETSYQGTVLVDGL